MRRTIIRIGMINVRTRTPVPIEKRFWKKVPNKNKNECWEWMGDRNDAGYGQISECGLIKKRHGAHRISWIIHHGLIPAGLLVCHKCDNPSCVNPSHLFLGTQRENLMDCIKKNRANRPKGENHHFAKLTTSQVIEIRKSPEMGIVLSETYSVSNAVISAIRKQKTWKSLINT